MIGDWTDLILGHGILRSGLGQLVRNRDRQVAWAGDRLSKIWRLEPVAGVIRFLFVIVSQEANNKFVSQPSALSSVVYCSSPNTELRLR